MPHNHNPQLDRIEHALAHQHDMLHGLSAAVADIARVVVPPPGGMTPDETARVTGRLHAAAAKLEGAVAPQPVPPVPET